MMARHFILKGRVQGVGFRYFARQTAGELGIQGWVKNLGSGEVEIHAQGSKEAMEKFQVWMNQGPSLAVVSEVEVTEVEPQLHTNFFIGR